MKNLSHFLIVTILFCGSILFFQSPSRAGLTDEEKKVWGASENASLTFTVPSSEGVAVMGKAQGIVSGWNGYDRYMRGMKIQTVTENLIETYNPIGIGEIGFEVTRTSFPQGDEIAVATLYYTGNPFSNDRKDAMKRAHLLSYILQVFAKNMVPLPVATVPSVSNPSVPTGSLLADDLELYLKLIRSQLADGKYDSAIAILPAFKSAIEDKQKSALSSPPPATVPNPSAVKPAPKMALPSDILK